MAGKPLKRAPAKSAPVPEAPREPSAAMLIAKRIEEDIVLGRRQPRERLIEQDLCDLFQTHRGDVLVMRWWGRPSCLPTPNWVCFVCSP